MRSVWLAACTIALASAAMAQEAATSSAPAGEPAASAPAQGGLDLATAPISELLTLADQARELRRFEDVHRIIDAILKRDPANLEAMNIRADAYGDAGDLGSAREWYKKVAAIQPADFRANFGQGKGWMAGRHWRQAFIYLENAERVAPQDKKGEVQTKLAIAYRGAGLTEKAIESITSAIKLDPDRLEARRLLVALRTDRAEFDRALAECTPLLELAKRDVEKKPADLGAIQQLDAAYATLLEVLSLYGGTFFIKDARGNRSDRVIPGKEAEAANVIRQVVDASINRANLALVMSYHNILPIAERAVGYDPRNCEYRLQHAMLMLKTGQTDGAILALQIALKANPECEEARRQLDSLGAPHEAPGSEPGEELWPESQPTTQPADQAAAAAASSP